MWGPISFCEVLDVAFLLFHLSGSNNKSLWLSEAIKKVSASLSVRKLLKAFLVPHTPSDSYFCTDLRVSVFLVRRHAPSNESVFVLF